MGVVKCCTI